jgi:hypothetical protein
MIPTMPNGPNHTLIHIYKSDTTKIQVGSTDQQQWTNHKTTEQGKRQHGCAAYSTQ